jgi:predicted ATP-binding protein involved in virulence
MSEPNHLLRIDHLQLKNFRCFAACELDLHPKLTILVAENAQGKTALLDALRLVLQEFVTTVRRGKQPHGFDRADIHLKRGNQGVMEPRLPTEFRVGGEVDGEPVSWRRVLSKDTFHARTSTKDAKDIRRLAKRLADKPDINDIIPTEQPTVLPVVAYYGTGRLYDEHRLTEGKRRLAESSPIRVSAYLDCLSPSSSYKSFSAWFGQKWEQVGDPRFRAVGVEARPENQIAAVREAISTVLEPTDWTTIAWKPTSEDANGRNDGSGYIALEHSQKGQLPLNHLSDGVRNMVALVGDLAHRCVRLNPFLGEEAAKRTPGIILVDEIEMHIHPRWQQLVVALMQAAFPTIQFVFSTHSPHVLSAVDFNSIRVIHMVDGQGKTSKPEFQTLGDESAGVLARVMDVNPVPDVESARWLSHYRALVQNSQDQSADALETLNKLRAHFGAGHHLLQEAAILRRLQEFKRQHNIG